MKTWCLRNYVVLIYLIRLESETLDNLTIPKQIRMEKKKLGQNIK